LNKRPFQKIDRILRLPLRLPRPAGIADPASLAIAAGFASGRKSGREAGMLHLNEITYRLGPRLLIDRATVAIPEGAHVGLVGRNGTGKSTLFRIVCGELAAEAGTVKLPKGVRIGRVEQEAPGGPTSLLDFVLAADVERASLLAEAETASDPARIADIHARLFDMGAHAAPARAAAILDGLGFDAEAQKRACSEFSGGWRMRVALAAILFLEPDLLLLDEPTNYLDLEGALWLQDYLQRYPHTVITVSHDRDFLDVAADHILHLQGARLTLYRGNYSNFARQHAEKRVLLEKASEKQAAQKKHLMAFVDRFRAKASKAKQAQSRLKRLEKMKDIELTPVEADAALALPSPEKPLSPPILALDGVSAGYGDRTVLKRLSLSIAEDDRIGLIGPNGNGKSTFVKLIADRLKPLAGDLKRAPRLTIAYFAQHQLDELPESETPYALVARRLRQGRFPDAGEALIRARTAQLGFAIDKADRPISTLSGGEKARLLIGLAAFDGPHLLILDEPTNHLDIEMREALVRALADYKGAVIIVSHDRFLLDSTCDQLWLVADGAVSPLEGDLDDYAKGILASRGGGRREPAEKPAAKAASRAPEGSRPPGRDARKRVEALEQQIAKLEALIAKVDGALADANLYAVNPARAEQLARDRGALAARLAECEEAWLAASEELAA
jgi:ATP-binding cassette subfamily F protein 3